MARPRIEIPPALLPEVRRRLGQGEGLDPLYAWLRGQGWPGSRASLAGRLAELRARPEDDLRAAAAAERGAPESGPAPPEANREGALDALAELRQAHLLMRQLARRAVAAIDAGGSQALALKAVDGYAALTLKIRRLEREERPREKGYRLVELRLPAKETVQ